MVRKLLSKHWRKLKIHEAFPVFSKIIPFLLENCRDRIYVEASKILDEQLNMKWAGRTYEDLRTKPNTFGFSSEYLHCTVHQNELSSTADIRTLLELAKLDLQKRTTIPELIFKCCQVFPIKEALEKLVELGMQSETAEKVAQSILEFQNHEGLTCPTEIFNLAAHGGSLCHPHLKNTPLQDSGRTVSRNEVFSKWG